MCSDSAGSFQLAVYSQYIYNLISENETTKNVN